MPPELEVVATSTINIPMESDFWTLKNSLFSKSLLMEPGGVMWIKNLLTNDFVVVEMVETREVLWRTKTSKVSTFWQPVE